MLLLPSVMRIYNAEREETRRAAAGLVGVTEVSEEIADNGDVSVYEVLKCEEKFSVIDIAWKGKVR